ncbi:cupredoxin domain-containing protein [Caulobacter sp. 17J80-11]|nr:cupredoxin domain-containing protein [Caulobacter sp. 17J80-11]MBC6981984.1 cupredoxin domain-containing protein [Caulobacter sp. 17J80-11]
MIAAGWVTVAAVSSAATAPKVHTVVIADMAFGPAPADVHVGDTVRYVNKDMFRHTATARDGSFDLDMQPKTSAETVVKKAGTINVYCRFHPGMKQALTVK